MPLKRSPAATVYEVGLTETEKKGKGYRKRKEEFRKGQVSQTTPIGEGVPELGRGE